jgi:hypothetical protein
LSEALSELIVDFPISSAAGAAARQVLLDFVAVSYPILFRQLMHKMSCCPDWQSPDDSIDPQQRFNEVTTYRENGELLKFIIQVQ